MYLGRQFGACRVVGGPDEPARARHICEIWDVCLRAVSATRRSWLHAKTLCMFLSCFALSKRFTCTCIIPICAVTPLKISFTPPTQAATAARDAEEVEQRCGSARRIAHSAKEKLQVLDFYDKVLAEAPAGEKGQTFEQDPRSRGMRFFNVGKWAKPDS
jgi:hypothetical protein